MGPASIACLDSIKPCCIVALSRLQIAAGQQQQWIGGARSRLPAARDVVLEDALQQAARRAVLATDAAFLRQAQATSANDGTTALFALLLGSRTGRISR